MSKQGGVISAGGSVKGGHIMGTTKHQVAQAVQNHCPVSGVHSLHHMGMGTDDDVHARGDGRLGHLLLEIVMLGIVFGAPVAGM